MKHCKYILLVSLLIFGSIANSQRLTDAQLIESQKQTLLALTQYHPEIGYPEKGIKGFYDFYKREEEITVAEVLSKPIAIVDISLFSSLPNLRKLKVQHCHVVDFSCLSSCTKLFCLYVDDCKDVLDLSSIYKLKNLRELSISNSKSMPSNNMMGIKELKRLKYLNLEELEIQDISFTSELINICNVEIFSCPINVTGDWNHLDSLKSVMIMYCELSSTSFLKECKNIEYLCLDRNRLKDIELNSKSIKNLSLEGNQIAQLQGIEECINLSTLDLQGNKLQDITTLSKLTNLKNLNLRKNLIKDVCPLSSLKNLEELDISENYFTDASCLSGLPHLKKFVAYGDHVYSCSPQTIEDIQNGCDCSKVEVGFYYVIRSIAFVLGISGLIIGFVVYFLTKFDKRN